MDTLLTYLSQTQLNCLAKRVPFKDRQYVLYRQYMRRFPKHPMEFNKDIDWEIIMRNQGETNIKIYKNLSVMLNTICDINSNNIPLGILHEMAPEDLCQISEYSNKPNFDEFVILQIRTFLSIQVFSLFLAPSVIELLPSNELLNTAFNRIITLKKQIYNFISKRKEGEAVTNIEFRFLRLTRYVTMIWRRNGLLPFLQ
jgi:hypothetical protein